MTGPSGSGGGGGGGRGGAGGGAGGGGDRGKGGKCRGSPTPDYWCLQTRTDVAIGEAVADFIHTAGWSF